MSVEPAMTSQPTPTPDEPDEGSSQPSRRGFRRASDNYPRLTQKPAFAMFGKVSTLIVVPRPDDVTNILNLLTA